MLKRITEQYTTADINEINRESYVVPTLDERQNPGMHWDDVVKARDKQNAFQGQFQCKLCPKKVLNEERDLAAHLQSKGHKLALKKFYKANEK